MIKRKPPRQAHPEAPQPPKGGGNSSQPSLPLQGGAGLGLEGGYYSKKLTYNDLNVTMPYIYEQMGYGVATDSDIESKVGDDVKAEVNGILEEIKTFLEPELYFYITQGSLSEDPDSPSLKVSRQAPKAPQPPKGGETEGAITSPFRGLGGFLGGFVTLNIGRIIHRQLRGSSLYAFFVCTAGRAFQEYQDRLKAEGDIMREFTANAIGSVLAEKTADVMEQELQKFLKQAPQPPKGGEREGAITSPFSGSGGLLSHTNRFSPGYCGWHVREQKLLFSILPEEAPCGVHLTDSCLMLPIKSVSGVIGIGENVRHLDYTCGLCDYEQCYKRRRRNSKRAT